MKPKMVVSRSHNSCSLGLFLFPFRAFAFLALALLWISNLNTAVTAFAVRETVDYVDSADGVALQGYIVYPSSFAEIDDSIADEELPVDGNGQHTVVILPDWNNVNDYEITRAQMIADELGYVAFVADIYGADLHDVQSIDTKRAQAAKYRSDHDLFNSRIRSAIEAAHTANPIGGTVISNRKVAILGYCLGGTGVLSYSFANTLDSVIDPRPIDIDFVGAVSFHGGLMDFEVTGEMASPVLVLSGGNDDAGTVVEDLENRLKAANATWQITRYSGVEHGFTVFENPNYNEWVDLRSWKEMSSFLRERFGETTYGTPEPVLGEDYALAGTGMAIPIPVDDEDVGVSISIAESGGFSGEYADPNHPNCKRSIEITGDGQGNGQGSGQGNGQGNGKGNEQGSGQGNGQGNGKGNGQGSGQGNGQGSGQGNGQGNGQLGNAITVSGTDGDPGCPADGSGEAWQMSGTIDGNDGDATTDTIVVDFSPKGGPETLTGQRIEGGIQWEDGNVWTKITTGHDKVGVTRMAGIHSRGIVGTGTGTGMITVETVDYDDEGFALRGYLAVPPMEAGSLTLTLAPLPAILIVPDWDGTSGPTGYEAERAVLAAGAGDRGYIVMVSDIYGSNYTNVVDMATKRELAAKYRSNPALFVKRIQAGVDRLLRHPAVDTSTVFVTGYCLGGSGALDYALSNSPPLTNVKAVVPIHGGLSTLSITVQTNTDVVVTPYVMILSGGVDDAHGNTTELELHLDAANAKWEISRYSTAQHGFTLWNSPAYHPMADSRSWMSTMSLFETMVDAREEDPGQSHSNINSNSHDEGEEHSKEDGHQEAQKSDVSDADDNGDDGEKDGVELTNYEMDEVDYSSSADQPSVVFGLGAMMAALFAALVTCCCCCCC